MIGGQSTIQVHLLVPQFLRPSSDSVEQRSLGWSCHECSVVVEVDSASCSSLDHGVDLVQLLRRIRVEAEEHLTLRCHVGSVRTDG